MSDLTLVEIRILKKECELKMAELIINLAKDTGCHINEIGHFVHTSNIKGYRLIDQVYFNIDLGVV